MDSYIAHFKGLGAHSLAAGRLLDLDRAALKAAGGTAHDLHVFDYWTQDGLRYWAAGVTIQMPTGQQPRLPAGWHVRKVGRGS